ncbi:MAG: hypothetical protein J6K48_04385 [Lachnospiraceae bacterium]|nr:hypothetical protein [Lachnospiraceae bacterium]
MKSYMERKYYLRGLGIGIAVTAIIMGIAVSDNQTMTDEEVIARAKELGMVENTLLSDMAEEGQEVENGAEDRAAEQSGNGDRAAESNNTDNSAAVDSVTAEDTADDIVTDKDAAEDNAADEDAIDDTSADEDAADAPAKDGDAEVDRTRENATGQSEDITSAAIKTITVTNGDGSYTVAKKLADVGVVTSAENFDTYLCQNGYDKKLRTGTFSIPADASDEQIARIVTGAE